MSLAAGTRLGPYEVVSAIGAGGMGEVYRARDTRLDRLVAVKVLPAAIATQRADARALPARGPRHRVRQPSAHLHHLRRRRARRQPLPRDGARRRRHAARGDRLEGLPGGPGLRVGHPARRRARCGARPRHRPPRPEAGQRDRVAAGPEGARLRRRQARRRSARGQRRDEGRADRSRGVDRDGRVHGARAGARRAGRSARRPLRARARASTRLPPAAARSRAAPPACWRRRS